MFYKKDEILKQSMCFIYKSQTTNIMYDSGYTFTDSTFICFLIVILIIIFFFCFGSIFVQICSCLHRRFKKNLQTEEEKIIRGPVVNYKYIREEYDS